MCLPSWKTVNSSGPGPAYLSQQCLGRGPQLAHVELRHFGKTSLGLGKRSGGDRNLCIAAIIITIVFFRTNLQLDFEVSFNFVHMEKVNILYHSLD